MENKFKNAWKFIKKSFIDLFDEIEETDQQNYEKELIRNSFFEKIKLKQAIKMSKDKELNTVKALEKKYINRNQAISIADSEKNLRRSMYNEAINEGFNYGLIEINNYYATLVKFENRYAWYIKVIDGKYGAKKENKYIKGYFDEYSNIRCLVFADNGMYVYLNKNFDTRNIRMVTDDEFLFYINNIKH